MRRAPVLIGIIVAALGGPRPGRAEPPSPCADIAAPPGASRGAERAFKRHLEQATQAYDAGRYGEAITALRAAYALVPLPDVLFNLAQTCRKAGHERDALDLYQRSAEVNPDPTAKEAARRHVVEIRARLGQREDSRATLLLEQRRHGEAAAAWQAAYELSPSPLYLYRLGKAQELAGRPQQAMAAYEKFLAEDPRSELRGEAERAMAVLRAGPEPPPAGEAPVVAERARPVAPGPRPVVGVSAALGRERRPLPRLLLGAGAAAAGATLAGIGAWGLSLHGTCATAPVAPATECERLYNSRGGGAALLAVGATLVVGGVVLMSLPGRRAVPARVAAAPGAL